MKKQNESTLSERLSWARKNAGLRQEEVVKRVKISQPTLSGLESGKYKKTSVIAELAACYDVSPYWLATGKGDPKATDRSGIDAFFQLNEKNRQAVAGLIDSLLAAQSEADK